MAAVLPASGVTVLHAHQTETLTLPQPTSDPTEAVCAAGHGQISLSVACSTVTPGRQDCVGAACVQRLFLCPVQDPGCTHARRAEQLRVAPSSGIFNDAANHVVMLLHGIVLCRLAVIDANAPGAGIESAGWHCCAGSTAEIGSNRSGKAGLQRQLREARWYWHLYLCAGSLSRSLIWKSPGAGSESTGWAGSGVLPALLCI